MKLEDLHKSLTQFIVGCGLPFSLVENPFFKEFVCNLNKPYSEKLPSRKKLSTTLLDEFYTDVIQKSKKLIPKHACLLADSWRNTAGKQQNFSVIIHNAKGPPFFVDTFDYTKKPENKENLSASVRKSM